MDAARPLRESPSDADTGRASGILGIAPAAPLSKSAQAIAGAYLRRILTARVYDVAVETPLEPAKNLSRRLGNHVLLKREDTQSVFSFKLRGAYNKMINLPPDALQVVGNRQCRHADGRLALGWALAYGHANAPVGLEDACGRVFAAAEA